MNDLYKLKPKYIDLNKNIFELFPNIFFLADAILIEKF